MEVHQLRTLRELRDRGSVTAAAEALSMSASAVSQQLAALQRSFRVPLTQQRGRVVVLTQAGERLADAASGVVASLASARAAVDDFVQTTRGTVSVTAFHSAGMLWFPQLIKKSSSCPAGPAIQCRDEDVSVSEFVDLAADFDLVIGHRPVASPEWPAGRVTSTPLLVEPIDVALAKTHPLARKKSIRVEDLSGQSWLAVHEGFALEPLLLAQVTSASGSPLTLTHRVNEFNVAAAIIADTNVLGLLPRYTGLPAHLRDQVELRTIKGLHLARHVDVLAREETLARRSVQVALDWIRAISRNLTKAPPS